MAFNENKHHMENARLLFYQVHGTELLRIKFDPYHIIRISTNLILGAHIY